MGTPLQVRERNHNSHTLDPKASVDVRTAAAMLIEDDGTSAEKYSKWEISSLRSIPSKNRNPPRNFSAVGSPLEKVFCIIGYLESALISQRPRFFDEIFTMAEIFATAEIFASAQAPERSSARALQRSGARALERSNAQAPGRVPDVARFP